MTTQKEKKRKARVYKKKYNTAEVVFLIGIASIIIFGAVVVYFGFAITNNAIKFNYLWQECLRNTHSIQTNYFGESIINNKTTFIYNDTCTFNESGVTYSLRINNQGEYINNNSIMNVLR
ncbi:MAG: hypothetical protein QW478_04715 [Candidatus Micrarchaeaceae archaeon]